MTRRKLQTQDTIIRVRISGAAVRQLQRIAAAENSDLSKLIRSQLHALIDRHVAARGKR